MIESMESFRRKIGSANELQSVVKNMKSLAASSLGQYEMAIKSLEDYYRTIELSLATCIRDFDFNEHTGKRENNAYVIVFGSDQGLVGQFNNDLVDFLQKELNAIERKSTVYSIGDRIKSSLEAQGIFAKKTFEVPNSVNAITPLISQLLTEVLPDINERHGSLFIFNQKPLMMPLYTPTVKRLLPLDLAWGKKLRSIKWPTSQRPQIIGNKNKVLLSLTNEYLFVSLFQSCAESLASENSSRMASMQRAEKNIEELLGDLQSAYNRFRQNTIDQELFEILAGFEAIMHKKE